MRRVHCWSTISPGTLTDYDSSFSLVCECWNLTLASGSRRSTFIHLTTWLTDARNQTHPNTTILLIGNKTDLTAQREVPFEEAERFAEENGTGLFGGSFA